MSADLLGGFAKDESITFNGGVFNEMQGRVLGRQENGMLQVEFTIFGRAVTLPFEANSLRGTALDEEAYLACGHAHRLVSHLANHTTQPGRKIVLFGIACLRTLENRLEPRFREAIDQAEQWADRPASAKVRKAARTKLVGKGQYLSWGLHQDDEVRLKHHLAGLYALNEEAWPAWSLVYPTSKPDAYFADLCRCVFGNPFSPAVIDPTWLAWEQGVVPRLARDLYDERRFDEMPVLADALEDAGCTDESSLGHARSPIHTRGCWLLDAILG